MNKSTYWLQPKIMVKAAFGSLENFVPSCKEPLPESKLTIVKNIKRIYVWDSSKDKTCAMRFLS
ncbi:hypothetical protein [Fluoribacter gormanii]|uniref:hypothetical protein n=1 Tax=Fluoribacter gormanii TaxID=464 RepID=UPI0010417104|nr:hypothetical protein [Fluoribacter gormanii]